MPDRFQQDRDHRFYDHDAQAMRGFTDLELMQLAIIRNDRWENRDQHPEVLLRSFGESSLPFAQTFVHVINGAVRVQLAARDTADGEEST